MKIVFAALFLLLFSLPSLAVDGPCLESIDQQHPIGDQRGQGTMIVNALMCEQMGRESLVTSYQNYNDLTKITKREICNKFSPSPCNSLGFFDFINHGDRYSDFLTTMESHLYSKIETIPASIQSLGQDEIDSRAMMFLCTQYQIQKNIRLLNDSGDPSTQQRAIDQMAELGLLPLFMQGDLGKDFLGDQRFSEDFRIQSFHRYLENLDPNDRNATSLVKRFQRVIELLEGRENLDERKQADLRMAQLGSRAIQSYLNLSVSQQDPQILSFLERAQISGASEAVSRYAQSSHEVSYFGTNTDTGGSGGGGVITQDIAGGEPVNSYPNCSSYNLQDFSASDYNDINSRLYSLISQRERSNVDGNFPQRRPVQDYWQWLQDIYTMESPTEWYRIELAIGGMINPQENLESLRQNFCYHQGLMTQVATLREQIQNNNVSPQLANQIFSSIQSRSAQENYLSLIKELFPHLSEENKLAAIEAFKVGAKASSNVDFSQFRQWRFNTLTEILDEFSGNLNQSIPRSVISALAYEGSQREENKLAEIFGQTTNTDVRQHILSHYSERSLLRDTGGDLQIIETIASIEDANIRNQYLTILANSLSRVEVQTGNQGNLAIDQDDVSASTMAFTLRQMVTLSTDDHLTGSLQNQIRIHSELAAGVNGDEPANDRKPFAPAVAYQQVLLSDNSKPNDISGISQISNISNSRDGRDSKPRNVGNFNPQSVGNISELEAIRQAKMDSEFENSASETIPSSNSGIFEDNQNNFFSNVSQALGFPAANQNNNQPIIPPIAPTRFPSSLGEDIGSSSSKSSFNNSFARVAQNDSDLNSESEDQNDFDSPSNSVRGRRRNNNQDLINEIQQISQDTANLRREIDNLDGPAPALLPSQTPTVADNSREDSNSQNQESFNQNRDSNSRNIGFPSQNNPARTGTQRGGNGRIPSSTSPEAINAQSTNPFSQGLLSPYDDPSREDLSKIIKITTEEEKNLLMNYMAANEQMSCPELRFIQNFYDKNVNKFILSKRRKPWREYALLELDGMNFRFNYPGTSSLREKIDQTCSTLAEKGKKKTLGEDGRAPASVAEANEVEEIVPSEAQPATEEKGLIKKFMLKLGL